MSTREKATYPPPLEFPLWQQHCTQCGKSTGSKVLIMQAGLGNACAGCGKLRKGRPYLSKADLEAAASNTINALKPFRAKGGSDELAKSSN